MTEVTAPWISPSRLTLHGKNPRHWPDHQTNAIGERGATIQSDASTVTETTLPKRALAVTLCKRSKKEADGCRGCQTSPTPMTLDVGAAKPATTHYYI